MERRLAMDLGLSVSEVESFLADNRGIDEETSYSRKLCFSREEKGGVSCW
jgi:hypothetical protein